MTYRIFYKDGNQRLVEAKSIKDLFEYLLADTDVNDIVKIELDKGYGV